jgi:hypothetical protein
MAFCGAERSTQCVLLDDAAGNVCHLTFWLKKITLKMGVGQRTSITGNMASVNAYEPYRLRTYVTECLLGSYEFLRGFCVFAVVLHVGKSW